MSSDASYKAILLSPDKTFFLMTKTINFLISGLFPVVFIYYFGIEGLGKAAQAIAIVVACKSLLLFTAATLIQKIAIKNIDFRRYYVRQFFTESGIKIALSLFFLVLGEVFISLIILLTIFSSFRENVASFLGINSRFIAYGILSNIPNVLFLIFLLISISLEVNTEKAVFISYACSDLLFFLLALLFMLKFPSGDLTLGLKIRFVDILTHYVMSLPTAIQSSAIAFFSNSITPYSAGLFKVANTIGSFGNMAGITLKELIEPIYKKKIFNQEVLTSFVDRKWLYVLIFFAVMLLPVALIYGYLANIEQWIIVAVAYGLGVSSLLVALSSPHLLYLYRVGLERFVVVIRWAILCFFFIGSLVCLQFESYASVVGIVLVMIISRTLQSSSVMLLASQKLAMELNKK